MAFKKFIVEENIVLNPVVSMRPQGILCFLKDSVKQYHIKDFKFAALFYDCDRKRIGIELTNDQSLLGVHKLAFDVSNAMVSIIPFMKHFKIPFPKKVMRYVLKKDKNILFFQLD